MTEEYKLSKENLDQIILCIENRFNLTEEEINKLIRSEYTHKYLPYNEGFLILLRDKINNHRLYFFRQFKLDGITVYSCNLI